LNFHAEVRSSHTQQKVVLDLVPAGCGRGVFAVAYGTVVAADVYRIVHVLLLASLDVFAGGE